MFSNTKVALTAAILAVAPFLSAGGFWLQLGDPEASPEAKANHAALIVKAGGCHDPATAEVSGIVIRMVDGRKETTPLKLIRMKEPGTFSVLFKWPSDLPAVLEFVGHNAGASTSMLVNVRGGTVERSSVRFYPHVPTAEEENLSLTSGQ